MAGRLDVSRKRPWGVLIPPPWPLDEFAFLSELLEHSGKDSSVAECLWTCRRAISAWVGASPIERATLFERRRTGERAIEDLLMEAATAIPELTSAFHAFRGLMAQPDGTLAESLTTACEAVVEWSENHGYMETAVQFVEAAASVSPESPLLANAAARICRAKGLPGRAEIWYDRAVGLSRAAGDVLEYINANLGFGAVLLERRSFRAAQKRIRRAGTRARQRGMREQAAEAFHDAFAVAIVAGDPARAAHFARRAIDAYPRHATRYPALAYDLAYLLTCSGMYREAVTLLELAAERIKAPSELILVLGTLARAAAGSGERQQYAAAVARVSSMAGAFTHTAAAALYNVGEGARLLGEWEAAGAFAAEASELARRTNSEQIVWLAASLERAVGERRPGTPLAAETDPLGQLLSKLADVVSSRLQAWRGPTWRPRRASDSLPSS